MGQSFLVISFISGNINNMTRYRINLPVIRHIFDLGSALLTPLLRSFCREGSFGV